jgi:hypothetical protein
MTSPTIRNYVGYYSTYLGEMEVAVSNFHSKALKTGHSNLHLARLDWTIP